MMVMAIMLVKMTMMMVMIVGMCLQKYDVDVISREFSLPILFYQGKACKSQTICSQTGISIVWRCHVLLPTLWFRKCFIENADTLPKAQRIRELSAFVEVFK